MTKKRRHDIYAEVYENPIRRPDCGICAAITDIQEKEDAPHHADPYNGDSRAEHFPEFDLFEPYPGEEYWQWTWDDRLIALAFMIVMTE